MASESLDSLSVLSSSERSEVLSSADSVKSGSVGSSFGKSSTSLLVSSGSDASSSEELGDSSGVSKSSSSEGTRSV